MFEKLLALVPYNPGIIPQLSFYSRRMREEASIRRTGTIFLVLAFMIQFFAVLSPPQATMASSSNDIITGGVSSIDDAHNQCKKDTQGFQRILHYYGISCDAFNSASVDYISQTDKDNGKPIDYFSMGRNPSSGTDTPVNIPGEGNKVYWRNLKVWPTSTWKAIHLQSQSGRNFWVMYDCANLVARGLPNPNPLVVSGPVTGVTFTPSPTPPTPARPNPAPPTPPTPSTPTPPPPAPTPPKTPCQYNSSVSADSPLCKPPCEYNSQLFADDLNCKPCDKSISSVDKEACIDVHKTASNITAGVTDANNTTAKAGDVITYTLFANNKGKATVKGFVFQENMSDVLDYADITDLNGGSMDNDKVISWPAIDIKSDETRSVRVTVKVKDPIPSTPVSTSDPSHFDLIMTNVYGSTVAIYLKGSPAKQVEVAAATLPNTGPGTTLMIGAAIVVLAGYFYGRSSLLARESEIAVKETAYV